MKLYGALSRLGFLKRYSHKFFFVAFVGIHLPLIALIVLLLADSELRAGLIVTVAVATTLLATAITFWVQHQLTLPIRLASRSLVDYRTSRVLPMLPTGYADEAGVLMRDVRHTVQQLDGALREKEELIGLISHDLRGPLGSCLQLLDLLEMPDEGEDQRVAYRRALRASLSQQQRLVENLLVMLRMEGSPPRSEVYPWAVLAREATEAVEPAARQKRVQLENDYPDDDLNVEVQPGLFVQAVKNVLFNAVKYTHSGRHVTLRAHRRHDRLEVTCSDEGVGFEPHLAEVLFERFTPQRRRGTAREPTVGLGLYLSRRIVERHGGTLRAHSDGPGRGAVFTIVLPLAPAGGPPPQGRRAL